MGRKGEPALQPISPAGRESGGDAGFTLLEVICALAILAVTAAIVLPRFPRGTSMSRLEAYALSTASALRADRDAAIRRRDVIGTAVDAKSRLVRSGATHRAISLPSDVDMDVVLPARCGRYGTVAAVVFFPTGMSCGGVITLSRDGVGFEVRVNWLVGGVNVVRVQRS
jgi:general secretion pathway protein H